MTYYNQKTVRYSNSNRRKYKHHAFRNAFGSNLRMVLQFGLWRFHQREEEFWRKCFKKRCVRLLLSCFFFGFLTCLSLMLQDASQHRPIFALISICGSLSLPVVSFREMGMLNWLDLMNTICKHFVVTLKTIFRWIHHLRTNSRCLNLPKTLYACQLSFVLQRLNNLSQKIYRVYQLDDNNIALLCSF